MEFFYKEKELIDNFIKSKFKNNFYDIDRAIKYSLFTGGKRLRPIISVILGNIFGVKARDILPFAAAIEYLHSASLIHDDLPIMDNDDTRRGKPSVHKKYSDDIALLAGDIMVSESMNIINEYDYEPEIKNELLKLLSKTWGRSGISGGQALEKEKIKEINPLKIFRMKTGSLFGASFLGPAIINKTDDTYKKEIYFIGVNIGIIYQINDDIADKNDKSYNILRELKNDFIMEYRYNMIKQINAMLKKNKLKDKKLDIVLSKILKEE